MAFLFFKNVFYKAVIIIGLLLFASLLFASYSSLYQTNNGPIRATANKNHQTYTLTWENQSLPKIASNNKGEENRSILVFENQDFAKVMEQVREKVLKSTPEGNISREIVKPGGPIVRLWEPSAFNQLRNFTDVITTVVLPRLIPRPFTFFWSAENLTCINLDIKRGPFMYQDYSILYNQCQTNMSKTLTKIPLATEDLNIITGEENWNSPTMSRSPEDLLHIEILKKAIIPHHEGIITEKVKVIPRFCKSKDVKDLAIPKSVTGPFPHYREIFVLSHYWSDQYGHAMTETFPRLAPFLNFLRSNPQIYVHAVPFRRLNEILLMLGLKNIVISGTCSGDIVYLPRGTRCGNAHALDSQLMNDIYREHLSGRNLKRNLVVFIARTKRGFTHQEQIKQVVQKLAAAHGLELYVFGDRPSPGLDATMEAFNRAVVIVAPHGAGLGNMYYSQPGTWILETVCNRPLLNMVFQRIAHVLGHHYHALVARSGCDNVETIAPEIIGEALQEILSLLSLSD